jgi:hypothetical protein
MNSNDRVMIKMKLFFFGECAPLFINSNPRPIHGLARRALER